MRRIGRGTAVIAAGVLAVATLSGPPAAAAVPTGSAAIPRHAIRLTTLPYRPVKGVSQTSRRFIATAARWPTPVSGTITLPAPTTGRHVGAMGQAVGMPTLTQAVAPVHGNWVGPSRLGVRVEPQSLSRRLGIPGVVWQVSGLTPGSGNIRAGISYRSFSQVYGGNYGLRLTLIQLPACALTTPQLARCRAGTPLRSVNDYKASTVSATLPLPTSASGGQSVVLAATSTTGADGGAPGTYAATSLKPSGSWTVGGSSGSFTYTYPIALPGASSKLVPSAGLSYDSGSVDGQTAVTQTQANWAGDGWSTADSFIEQTFVPCKDEPEGVTNLPAADKTQDMCYDGNFVSLSLNGITTALVLDGKSGKWRLQNDNGAVVTPYTGGNGSEVTVNSDNVTYWEIQERDGTTYWFGRNQLPGYTSGDSATNSVDYEPVYSTQQGDPCYNPAGFTSSVCTMAYRWHLDYVTDSHGDAMANYYHQDLNYYAQDTTGSGPANAEYVRDSYLTGIDYGFRAGGAYGTVPDKIIYTTGPRCFPDSTANPPITCGAISSGNSGTPTSDYPDIPYDLNCAQGATCTADGPSYWSTVRLKTIITKQYSASAGTYNEVDEYALDESLPKTGDGTSPTLWLGGIIRTGEDTSAGPSAVSQALPEVTFGGIDLSNRVDTSNFPGLYRYRINKITNELGGVTGITYGTPDACTASYVASADPATNENSCYPVWWWPAGYQAAIRDWFEKYAVKQVLQSDTTGYALTQQTNYSYADPTDGGAAWHYDDNEGIKPEYRTYGQFRGYASVTTTTGDVVNDPQTESVTSYYQGMSDDNNATTATVKDSQGGVHDDNSQLAGMPLETTVYTGDTGSGGTVDHSTIYSYWVSASTASESRPGLNTALTANMAAPAEVWTRQALTDGGNLSWRYTETDTTYDNTDPASPNFGLPMYVYTHTIPVDAAYDRCTATTYAPANTSTNLAGLVASQETDSVACSGFTEGSPASVPAGLNTLDAPSSVSRPAQVVSASQNFYDDPAFSTTFPQTSAPTIGNLTMTRKAVDYTSGAFTWQTTVRDAYDNYGRVTAAYDGNGNESDTAYTVDTAGLTTKATVTDPLGQTTSQTFDPTRGLVMTATDANGVVTTNQYDEFGRLTSDWLDSRFTSTQTPPANDKYAYYVSDPTTNLSGVVAQKMGDAGGYATTVTILDSLGRVRQTQADTPKGGRLITDTLYDSRGWAWKVNKRYWDSAVAPTMSLAGVNGGPIPDSQFPDEDKFVFNGLGQAVQDLSREYGNTISTTTTIYNGDRTTVIPPTGGVTTATIIDPLGRTSQIDQYLSPPALHTPANAFTGSWYLTGGATTSTKYGYDGHGNQATITDADGNTWTSVYDLLGEVTSKTDPDTGTSTMVYDGNGNLLQSTDSRSYPVSWTYDALNRKTGEYAATTGDQTPGPSGNQIASWVYDNSDNALPGMTYPIGHVTTETTYSGGNTYIIQSQGFDKFGNSSGEKFTSPSSVGALAGSYTFSHSYTPGVGLPLDDTYPSGGGLPAEITQHTYLATPLDLPSGLGGTAAGYAQTTNYDAYGDVLQEEIGTGTNLATITSTYDPHTLQLTDSNLTRNVDTPKTVDEEAYSYDLYGNLTRQVSTRLGDSTTTETQCFGYDTLDRLKDAWTATDDCAAAPTAGSDPMVGDGLGSASEYWTTWNYDNLSRLTSQVQHDSVTGGTDTTTTDTYDGNSADQPHTLTSTTQTGGGTASSSFGYDTSGNMKTRDTLATGNQSLTWNNAEQLTKITSSTKGTTSYVYDADGNLLLQQDPFSTTLYLPGEQLTATGTTVTGARIIPLPGGGDVVRTGDTSNYYFEIPDIRGTNTVYLDSTAQTPTWRQFTPYGFPRGKTVAWIDNRGYLNKPSDTITGLTDLGAREYDPVTAQFLSPDPILKPSDPQDLDPYAYSEDNPVSNSDPSGLLIVGCGPSTCGGPGSGGNVGSSGGVPQGGTTSYGTSGGNGEAPSAPGTTVLPAYVQPVYNGFYQGYNARLNDPYLSRADSQWTLDALHQFCISYESMCGGGLYGRLVANFGGLAGMATNVVGVAIGMAGGMSNDLPAGAMRGNQEQARLDAAATEDLNLLGAGSGGLYGPYYRAGSASQTVDDMQKVLDTGELWGRSPRNIFGGGLQPRVKAYLGSMPDDSAPGSFEFYTSVPANPRQAPPGEIWWYGGNEGVRTFEYQGEDWAAIPVQVTRTIWGLRHA